MEPNFKKIFLEISKKTNTILRHNTHYEADNYQLEKWKDKKLYRLDFQPSQNNKTINITFYTDTFKCCPKILSWFHNNIPGFPYLAKITHKHVCTININEKNLKEKILNITRKII